MMRGNVNSRAAAAAAFSPTKQSAAAVPKEEVWEVRPGGMLVQKRSPDADPPPGGAPVPTIRVKVKHGGVYHEVYVNSQASFGELKKLLAEKTGLHPDDQKVVYKDKERDSKAFLDVAGVKDRSKMVLLEDPAAKAKRLLEERRSSKALRAAKAVARVGLDVDKLATKVSALEAIVGKGGKVVDGDVVALTEALMTELVKLDAIAAVDGEVREQRRAQEKRVQKLVETLDAIRAKNNNKFNKAAPNSNRASSGNNKAARPPRPPPQHHQQQQQRRQFQPPAPTTATAPQPQTQTQTASWETFDLLSAVPSTSAAPVTSMAPAMPMTTTTTTPSPRFEWELF